MGPLLEVRVTHPGDVAGARAGGADRLLLVAAPEPGGGRTPTPTTARAVCAEAGTQLPVRAVLRANDSWSTTGSEVAALQAAAPELAAAGVAGFCLGFLGPTLELDVAATEAVAAHTAGLPLTFASALDAALDHDRAWRVVRTLAGVDGVRTAGSTRGLDDGLDEVCRRAAGEQAVAELVVAGGGLLPEHVPWLVRAGVRAFHVGGLARPERSERAYVDPAHVRSWRTLLDDTLAATL